MFMMKLYPRETSAQIQEHIYCDDSMLYEEFILFVYCLSCNLKIFSQKKERKCIDNSISVQFFYQLLIDKIALCYISYVTPG
jgi:hypothetical protein